ncbi:hypothetical protein [Candidatus Nitrososphaera gargensis]|nr:hypothetical protein [Candidatus Nitrososphaera gargensis]
MADLTDRQHYCKYCSKEFKPERSTRRYCSDGCRIKMWYKRNGRSRRNRKSSSSGRKAKQKKQAE